ncbi:tRNA G18 (ribose-2'-O)-methylase SpoU [Candidatus Termititenax persephonae]|uniref:tRNA G18 (Ribose-2'-O)-methylase SpoU n=1 Tax=Candidatus Termititenax persephonae TaxID=2218525 RepID=A0A388TI88_9BACT|nr:tRNA G18 (ribose-2'-O)-methylase SpoU [Candidatus Termititenax persephonae]
MLLTSADNPEIKNLRKLLADSAARREQKSFVIEGFKIFQFARQIQTIYAREDIILPAQLRIHRHRYIAPTVFAGISEVENPQGIMAVCRLPEPGQFSAARKYIFLDRLQDPGNLGTIVRTAAALGWDGLICNKGCADIFAPKAVRASMGALFTLDILFAEIGEIAGLSGQIIAADLQGVPPEDLRLDGGYVLAVGSEGQGLSPEVGQCAAQKVCLPFHKNKAESLNAAVAAGILLYELSRRGQG